MIRRGEMKSGEPSFSLVFKIEINSNQRHSVVLSLMEIHAGCGLLIPLTVLTSPGSDSRLRQVDHEESVHNEHSVF